MSPTVVAVVVTVLALVLLVVRQLLLVLDPPRATGVGWRFITTTAVLLFGVTAVVHFLLGI